jgi:Ca2+-transporting ATPase
VGYGVLLSLATALCLYIGVQIHGQPDYHANLGHAGEGLKPHAAQTMAFMTLALAQLFHVFNSRKSDRPMRGMEWFSNKWVLGAIVLTIALQLLAVYAPGLSRVLSTHPLSWRDWGIVLACSLLPLVVGQTIRRVRAAL